MFLKKGACRGLRGYCMYIETTRTLWGSLSGIICRDDIARMMLQKSEGVGSRLGRDRWVPFHMSPRRQKSKITDPFSSSCFMIPT